MNSGLDVFATLQHLLRRAMAQLPGAQRSSLLVSAGQRLVYRAAIGFDGLLVDDARLPADAGALSASAPFGPAAAPEAAEGPRLVPAAAWYDAHLPGARRVPSFPPDGAAVCVVPVPVFGAPGAYLTVERSSDAPLSDDDRALLASIAERAGLVIERRGLFDEKAQAAQELRLLEDVLNAVAESVDFVDLIETVGDGIRSVQLGPQWTAIDLAILEGSGDGARAAEGDWLFRVYKAPRRPLTGYWNNVRDGALAAGRDLGARVEFKLGMASGPASQGAIIDQAIRRGVQGIVVAPIDAAALEPYIRRASDAGIPVVTIDSPPAPGSRSLLYIGTDNVAAGRLAGEMMTRLLPQGGLVAPQGSSIAALNCLQRIEGFTAGVAGSAIRVDAPTEDLFDVERGIRLAFATLEANPEIAGAFGVCSENGSSLGLASRRLGRAGELKIIAFDLVPSTLAMLRDGVIHAAIVQREYDMGYHGVRVLHDMATRGVEAALAELPASRFIDTGVDVVTLERTSCSISLADHLASTSARRVAHRRPAAARGDREIDLLVVGMAEREVFVEDEQLRAGADSLIGRVMSSARSVIVDPTSPDCEGLRDIAEARRSGARTVALVPLRSRDGVLGVLLLHSARAGACSARDLALIERVASVVAVVIENARLLSRIKDRTRDLEAVSRHQEALLRTIAELSSPVVPIARGVLVMPLVGTMDAQRSGRFIESMLQEITDHAARVVIVDVTGMAVVDASAAHHLVQAARAAGLLGAEVVLAGISPEAARLMVDQGLVLDGVVTRSTLELAFSYALQRTGGRVVYRDA